MSDPTSSEPKTVRKQPGKVQIDELVLNTETVRDLTDEESQSVVGASAGVFVCDVQHNIGNTAGCISEACLTKMTTN